MDRDVQSTREWVENDVKEKQLQRGYSRHEGCVTWVQGVQQNRLCQRNK